jgi:hypothetical protein
VTVVTIGAGPFVYNGAPHTPATVSVTGAGGLNQAPPADYLDNVAAGTATASSTFAGDDNHTGSSDSKTFTIDPAASVTTVTCPASVTFTGGAQEVCSATATGVGGLNQSLSVSYLDNINAGTATADASYPGDANHTNSSDHKTFAIEQASSVTDVTCPAGPFTFNGSAHTPCSVSVTGAGGLNLAPTPSYANNVNAGTATASYTFAGDANHTGSNDSANFTIDQASSVTLVTCTAGTFVYTGSPFMPCSATATGAGGLNQSLTVSYADNIDAGTATASASFADGRELHGRSVHLQRPGADTLLGAGDGCWQPEPDACANLREQRERRDGIGQP